MASDVIIKSYHIKHRLCLNSLLESAKQIADYAVANKANKKLLTSKYVKHFGLPSAVSNQILRKYLALKVLFSRRKGSNKPVKFKRLPVSDPELEHIMGGSKYYY